MGNRGKIDEQNRARDLRAEGWALQDIADELGVAKSSASIWTRGVEFEPQPRRRTARVREPGVHQRRRLAEIEEMDARGLERFATLNEQAFLAAGVALYAGEGAKAEGGLKFANSDPLMIVFFCRWLRHFFEVEESRMRCQVYLHQGLDLEETTRYWSELTGIPIDQFTKAYRAVPDPSIRTTKHVHGCCYVRYSCTRTHREVMGLIRALLSGSEVDPG